MRIIAGTAGGRKIEAPQGDATRPTHDRDREAVFSMLGACLHGELVLDLFAGSGALGLEALSRGASQCVFGDWDKRAVSVIRQNVTALGFCAQSQVFCLPWQQTLRRVAGKQFDLVFLDPPYEGGHMDKALAMLLQEDMLAKDARLVCEIRSSAALCVPDMLRTVKHRRYGMAQIYILERKADGE